jgi:hypothetical protein
MSSKDIEAEMKALREQVEALLAKQSAPSGNPDRPPGETAPHGEEHTMQEELHRMREKVAAFAELLRDEAREIPAASAVAIFALGVLMGRLLPR